MNWKKALLVLVVAGFALVFFAVAAVGLAATAGVTAAAIAISESGVVQAFEEVAEGAERLQIDVDGNSVTFTNPDSGESRVVVTDEHLNRGRVDFNLPEITVTDGESGERVVFGPGPRGEIEVTVPQITITDPDSGQSRVIRPHTDFRAPRVVWDGDYTYGPELGLRIVGGIFRGLFSLAALVLIATGAFLLLRNRRRAQDKLDQVAFDNVETDKTS
ncbi:MAG TPA: hypothetical protein VLE70_05025 [Anaerolineae bacterium]|nr:hypothetical protein [Anaerolineae bacterium]